MNSGSFAVAIVRHEVVLVQLSRTPSSHERNVDVVPFRHFGHRTFLADSSMSRTRIPTTNLLSILPTDAERCPISGMLELPENAYGQYAENIKHHQRRLSHVWSAMPFRVNFA
ncbi:hypothetical protein BU17DRAFT_49386 [Hysterangium stoloniferum]|nr:hypothetical protein BU17DRAFT_49386 [Hysterangium stoloniferum]